MNKKFLSIVCAAVMGCCTIPQTPLRAKAKTSLQFVGDVNKDGEVTSTDASLILHTYAEISSGKETDINVVLADFNHDGEVTSTDASDVLKFYAGVATGAEANYEIIRIEEDDSDDPETPKNEDGLFAEYDYVQYRKTEIKVYTKPEENSNFLYEEKSVLTSGDRFIVVSVKENDWYQIAFLQMPDVELYIRIVDASEFAKIGTVEVLGTTTTDTTATTAATTTSTETVTESATTITATETAIESATTITATETATESTTTITATETATESATTTTTTETATESATTTTATETVVETTTTTATTETSAESTTTTTEIILDNEFSIGSIFEFIVENGSWYIHNSTSNSASEDLYPYKNTLKQGDKFVILEKIGNWYKVQILEDSSAVDEVYLFINESGQMYFKKVGNSASVTTTTTTEPTTTSTTSTSTATTTTTTTTTTVTTTLDDEVKIGAIMRFTLEGGTWFIHNSITSELDSNLYAEKPYLFYGDDFLITDISGSWYTVKINGMQNNLYIRIPASEWRFFTKVGQVVLDNSETSTTVAETEITVTTESMAYKFVGISWNIRSAPVISDNVVGYLSTNDIFYIKDVTEGNWARIYLNNIEENFYVQIDNVNFQKV